MDTYRLQATGNAIEVVKENEETQAKTCRTRKPTILKLQWLAERSRKCEKIRKEISENKYHVDSTSIAKALLNLE